MIEVSTDRVPRLAFVSPLGFGGATTFLCNLTGELSRRGVSLIVLSPEKENPFAPEFKANGVLAVCQDEERFLFEDRIEATGRALASFRPTAVFACLGVPSYEVLRYVPAGIKRVALVHADHAIFYDAIAPYAECIDEVIGVSEQICATMKTLPGFADKPIRYLTSGVVVPGSEILKCTAPGTPLRLLYLGRLENNQKRVRLFPEILSRLVEKRIPFQWTIAGEGPEKSFLEESMKTSQPDQQVRIISGVAYQEVPRLLAEHDVFLLASMAEGLPMSMMEAMAHGLVPVVSDLPSGIRQLIDADSGILVPPDSVSGYAEAIFRLHQHRDELRRMSARAQQKIRAEFSVAALTEKWLEVVLPVPAQEATWPRSFRIQPPLNFPSRLRFSPLLRPLRRLALRWKYRSGALRPSNPS